MMEGQDTTMITLFCYSNYLFSIRYVLPMSTFLPINYYSVLQGDLPACAASSHEPLRQKAK